MRTFLSFAFLTILAGALRASAASVDRGVAASATLVAAAAAEPDTARSHDHDDDHETATEPPTVSLAPAIAVEGAGAPEQQRVDEALARFAQAGMMLPDLEIVFHDDPSGCKGHDGLFQDRYTPWRVLVCSGADFVLTHELAHAWEMANLDDDDREQYLELRGLPTWNSSEADWGERGVEDAAFMLQQNLMAGAVDTTSDRWRERVDAFAFLTGQRSPVLLRDGCRHRRSRSATIRYDGESSATPMV